MCHVSVLCIINTWFVLFAICFNSHYLRGRQGPLLDLICVVLVFLIIYDRIKPKPSVYDQMLQFQS